MLIAHNFAQGTVSTGYDASATNIALTSGHGARFPATGPFRCVWWNKTDYPNPSNDPNREIIEVTSRSTDTLTVVRGMETSFGGLAASTKNTGGKTYAIALVQTAESEAALSPADSLMSLSDIARPTMLGDALRLVSPQIWESNPLPGIYATYTGSGNGGGGWGSWHSYMATGTTQGSTCRSRISSDGWTAVARSNHWQFNYPFLVGFAIQPGDGFTGGSASFGRARVLCGKDQATAAGDLAERGIGVKLDGTTWYLQLHDGTTLANVALSANPSIANTHFVLHNKGDGNVDCYARGSGDSVYTLRATSAGGPTTNSAGTCMFEVENPGGAVSFHINFRHPRFLFL